MELQPESENQGETVLPYADARTDVEPEQGSADRTAAARLARVLGICMIVFGAILMLLMCAGLMSARHVNEKIVFIVAATLIAAYIIPGLILTITASLVRTGGRASAIVMLCGCIWALGSLGLSAIGAAVSFSSGRDGGGGIAQAIADICLLIGIGKLMYHVIRTIAYGRKSRLPLNVR